MLLALDHISVPIVSGICDGTVVVCQNLDQTPRPLVLRVHAVRYSVAIGKSSVVLRILQRATRMVLANEVSRIPIMMRNIVNIRTDHLESRQVDMLDLAVWIESSSSSFCHGWHTHTHTHIHAHCEPRFVMSHVRVILRHVE